MMRRHHSWPATIRRLLIDLVTFVCLAGTSRAQLAAENLFLRKQLALYRERRVKEHHRRARFERGPGDGDRRRHHFARRVEVVQFFAIGPPDGMEADPPWTPATGPQPPPRPGPPRRAGQTAGRRFRSAPIRSTGRPSTGRPARTRPTPRGTGSFRNTDGVRSPTIGTTQRSVFVCGSVL